MRRLPLFWLSIALLCGVLASASIDFLARFWVYLAGISLVGLAAEYAAGKWVKNTLIKKKWLPVPISLVCLIFFIGGWRYQASLPNFSAGDLAYYNDQGIVSIEGVVVSDPQVLERSTRLVIQSEWMYDDQREAIPIRGKVLTQFRMGEFAYGDRLLLTGVLRTPPENDEFSYREYLARSRVYSLMAFPKVRVLAQHQASPFKQALYSARQFIHLKIQEFLPQPEAALLSGILLGIETDIPPDLEAAFQQTGTAHIIAISGFNMTILAALFLKGFRRWLPVWWAGLLAVLAIAVYTLFVGAAPAVQRAAVMSSLSMTGALIGRRQAGPFTLLITAAIMVLINPLLLWDAGFQLSVMATLGLIVYADKIMGWFQKKMRRWFSEDWVKQISGPVGDYFLFTLAAQLTIFPVLLYHFESFSLSSFIANPLILPPQPFVMIFGGITVLVGLLVPFLGSVLSWVVWLPLVYTNHMVTWLAEIPASTIQFGQVSWLVVLVLYILIFGLTLKTKFRDDLFSRWKPLVTAAACAGSALLVWNMVFYLPDGKLKIEVFGSPYRQGVLLATPSGHTLLINPGEHSNTISAQLTQHKSVFDRSIDAVLVTSDKQQDYAALPLLLQRFQINRLLWANGLPDTFLAEEIDQTAYQKEILTTVFTEGMELDCGDGVRLHMLLAGEKYSVLQIEYENFHMFIVQGEVPDSFLDEPHGASVVILNQADQVLNWLPEDNGLVITPEGIPQYDSIPCIIGLNTVAGVEIVTDGQHLSFFKY